MSLILITETIYRTSKVYAVQFMASGLVSLLGRFFKKEKTENSIAN